MICNVNLVSFISMFELYLLSELKTGLTFCCTSIHFLNQNLLITKQVFCACLFWPLLTACYEKIISNVKASFAKLKQQCSSKHFFIQNQKLATTAADESSFSDSHASDGKRVQTALKSWMTSGCDVLYDQINTKYS